MKIYTEINYIWKDNKLIQTDSKSFDYDGEVTQAHTRKGGPSYARFNIPHSHSSTVNKITDPIKKGWESSTEAVKAGYDKIREDNPDPNLNVQTPKQLWDKGRQVLHDAATNTSNFINKNTDSIYTNSNDDSNDNGDSSKLSGQALALTQGGGDVEARREIQSRSEMGLTQGRKRTLLTA